MKNGVVIKPAFDIRKKVFYGFRGFFAVEFKDNVAQVGREFNHWMACVW
jgi:hypothetical protein